MSFDAHDGSYESLREAYAALQGELLAKELKAKEVIRQLQHEVEDLLEGELRRNR